MPRFGASREPVNQPRGDDAVRRSEAKPSGAALEAPDLRVRKLTYGDLPAVLSIERRSFQTPWSLGMFVLELSKPSGICL